MMEGELEESALELCCHSVVLPHPGAEPRIVPCPSAMN